MPRARAGDEMNWLNPRWQRLLMWVMRWRSPSFGRVPTFREAWTGKFTTIDVEGVVNFYTDGLGS